MKTMKKNLIFLALAFLSLLIACGKYKDLTDNDPLSNPSYMYGRLFLTDTLTQGLVNSPLGGKTINLLFSEDTDTLNYRFSTVTDANGYFKFPKINGKKTYRLIYNETVNGKLFRADTIGISIPQEKFELSASLMMTGQTGVIYKAQDTKGNPLGSVTICTSKSPLSYNNNNCDGSLYSSTTDIYGHVSAFGMSAGEYYAVAKATVNNVAYLGKLTFKISDKVEKRTITLDIQNPVNNTLSVTVVDQNNAPVGGARVCLFTSQIIAARDTCEGSNYSFLTGPSGTGSISNLVPNSYYILADGSVTNYKLLGRDVVIIGTGTVSKTIVIKH